MPPPTRIACAHCLGELRLAWRDLVPVGHGAVYPCPHCPRAWRFPYAWSLFVQACGVLGVLLPALVLAEVAWQLGRSFHTGWGVVVVVPMALAAVWLMVALNVRYLRRGRPLLPAWRYAPPRAGAG